MFFRKEAVVPPPGGQGALSHTRSLAPSQTVDTDWDSTDRTLAFVLSETTDILPSRHSPCHSLAVPKCKLHPLGKAGTGIQSQALTVPMRTGKHTVIGGAEPSQESHNPPGKKKASNTIQKSLLSSSPAENFFSPTFFLFRELLPGRRPPSPLFNALQEKCPQPRCQRH